MRVGRGQRLRREQVGFEHRRFGKRGLHGFFVFLSSRNYNKSRRAVPLPAPLDFNIMPTDTLTRPLLQRATVPLSDLTFGRAVAKQQPHPPPTD